MSTPIQILTCTATILFLGICIVEFIMLKRKRMSVAALESQNKRLRTLVNGLPEHIMIVDENLVVLDVHVQLDRLEKPTLQHAIGVNLHELYPSSTAKAIHEVVQKTIATCAPHLVEYSLLIDGVLYWYEGRALLLTDLDANKPRILWIPRDITDRKTAENSMIESEARFRSIFENSPVGILIADTSGYVVDINDAYLSIIGDTISREQIVGKHNLLDNKVFKQAGLQHQFQALYDSHQPVIAEVGLTTLGGHQITASYHGAPQFNEHGEFLGCVLICEDVSERIQARLALEQNELRYRMISEIISDFACSFSIDEHGHISPEWVTASFDRMTGYSVEEIFGARAWETLIHPDDMEAVRSTFQSLIHEASDARLLVRIYTKSGELRHIQVYFRSSMDDTGHRITQIVGAATDITDRIQAEGHERELEAHRLQVDLLESFISNMSHHFKNPLAVISTEVALMNGLQIHHIEGHLERIGRQVSRINLALDKLSALAQLDHDPSFQFVEQDINFILLELEISLLHLASQRNISLNMDIAETLPRLKLDEQWLSRALYELVENALFHSPDDGKVNVEVNMNGKHVMIAVKDEGDGIESQHVPQLFQRFYKVDAARTNTERPGVGLTIAQRVVEAHGGSIMVETEVGHGSTFIVKLPFKTEDHALRCD